MNYRIVLQQLGLLLVVLSGSLVVVALFALSQWLWASDSAGEFPAMWAMVITAGAGAAIGGLVWAMNRGKVGMLGRREAMLLVALSWIVGAGLAGLPFFIWAHLGTDAASNPPFRSFVNCYFESMSGLTTTGATILAGPDFEVIPRSLMLWRAMTHWLGGIGIVVLFVAVLPTLGVGGKKLYRVEAPGPAPEGVRPHIRETARILWFIYLGLTLAEVIALWAITPMDLFESICHTFATMATGGFSTSSASVGEWDMGVAPWIIIIFMVLAGGNFGLYYQALRGRLSEVWADPEFRLYLILIGGGALLVTMSIWGQTLTSTGGELLEPTPVVTAREALFTTVSIQTTTGFCTTDFDLWPFLAKAVLVTLMFVGGCAGSTAGGIKVIRVWIAMKIMVAEIEKAFRPNVVRPLKVASGAIDLDQRLGVLAYVFGIIFLFALGSVILMLLESHHPDMTYTTAATASLATLCTIGPGLEAVGAVQNYGWFTDPSKILMCVLMALGRLEVLAIIVLFSPSFWRK